MDNYFKLKNKKAILAICRYKSKFLLLKISDRYPFCQPEKIDFIDYRPYLNLNAKIAWYQPSRLAQLRTTYTNNHDVITYFTKGKTKTFNLDNIRVPPI